MLMLASVFNVVYVRDCTYPLHPHLREPSIRYMEQFNQLGQGRVGTFTVVDSHDVIAHFTNL